MWRIKTEYCLSVLNFESFLSVVSHEITVRGDDISSCHVCLSFQDEDEERALTVHTLITPFMAITLLPVLIDPECYQ